MKLLTFCLLFMLPLYSAQPSTEKIQALYHSLDPASLRSHLAFYELYKDTPEGKKALDDAWKLIAKNSNCLQSYPLSFPENIDAFISLIHPVGDQSGKKIHDRTSSEKISELCSHLANRMLKGQKATSIDEVIQLDAKDIDLARALLLAQENVSPEAILSYEAMLDLMTLEILARLPEKASCRDKIEALNHFIFYEMGFRFPPHSSYSDEIDRFTFLPQVLESKKGVCLGVSMLYLCLAQRIDLTLDIVTPPGHIFLRHSDNTGEQNIETTQRGVHIPSSAYLQINTKQLQTRSLKEVIGMLHVNHASVMLANKDFEKARLCYAKAQSFMQDDKLVQTLYGCSLFLVSREKEAKMVLEKAKQIPDASQLSEYSLLDDIVQGYVDKEGLATYFLYTDHTRASLEKKIESMTRTCQRCPKFRSGKFLLATLWLQLQRPKEALPILLQYHALDPNDITTEFYLAELFLNRFDAQNAFLHCKNAQLLAKKHNYMPKPLKEFAFELAKRYPHHDLFAEN